MRTLRKRHDRAVVELHDDRVIKTFATDKAAEREWRWYAQFPWATPKMVSRNGSTVVLQRLPLASELPEWRPVDQMRTLLERLHRSHVHHRDVHALNVVRMPDGTPRLIDWETAFVQRCDYSYDLHGPELSGIPKPVEHDGYSAQWWGAGTKYSLGRWWK